MRTAEIILRAANFPMSRKRQGSRLKRLISFSCCIAALLSLNLLSAGQSATVLYGPTGISPLAVRQGVLGSCFFHASVAAVARAKPSAIRSAIAGEPKRGYRVHFVTGPEELVYREDLDYAKSHGYDHSEGEWVAVLMRAYAQRELRKSMIQAIQRSTAIPVFAKPVALGALKQTSPLLVAYDRAIRSVVSQDGHMDKALFKAQLSKELTALGIPAAQSTVLEGLIEQAGFFESLSKTVQENGEVFGAYRSIGQGGIPINVIEAFMGDAHSGMVTDSAALTAKLRGLHAGGLAMVAGTKATNDKSQSEPNWFVAGHAYTLMDYDEKSRMVALRNPWAAHPGPDGQFKLPLSTFQQSYATFTASGADGLR